MVKHTLRSCFTKLKQFYTICVALVKHYQMNCFISRQQEHLCTFRHGRIKRRDILRARQLQEISPEKKKTRNPFWDAGLSANYLKNQRLCYTSRLVACVFRCPALLPAKPRTPTPPPPAPSSPHPAPAHRRPATTAPPTSRPRTPDIPSRRSATRSPSRYANAPTLRRA